ncbi:ATP-dependent DNA helicase PIF1-like protein [Tanacetum coccineum]
MTPLSSTRLERPHSPGQSYTWMNQQMVPVGRDCDDLPQLGCAHYYGTLCKHGFRHGNAIHSIAKANVAHNFLRLKEGSVDSIKNFVLQANKEEYRIFRDHAYMIELDGATFVRKTSVKGGGFFRYPFQLKELGSIELTDNKYLIDKLYLSSGSSTQILDDLQIHALKALRAENSEDEVSLSQAAVHDDYSQAKEGTLENLLIWARNRKNNVRVKINGIRTRKGWNFPSCCGEKCKKGVVRKEGSFWCPACDMAVEYLVLSYLHGYGVCRQHGYAVLGIGQTRFLVKSWR